MNQLFLAICTKWLLPSPCTTSPPIIETTQSLGPVSRSKHTITGIGEATMHSHWRQYWISPGHFREPLYIHQIQASTCQRPPTSDLPPTSTDQEDTTSPCKIDNTPRPLSPNQSPRHCRNAGRQHRYFDGAVSSFKHCSRGSFKHRSHK